MGWFLRAAGLSSTIRQSVVAYFALPPNQWLRGKQVLGRTFFHAERNAAGERRIVAHFINDEPLPLGVLRIWTTGMPFGNEQAWHICVAENVSAARVDFETKGVDFANA